MYKLEDSVYLRLGQIWPASIETLEMVFLGNLQIVKLSVCIFMWYWWFKGDIDSVPTTAFVHHIYPGSPSVRLQLLFETVK